MRRVVVFICALALSPCLGAAARAQTSSTGAVSGRVVDSRGDAVAGAEVELRNAATGVSRRQPSGGAGQYAFPSVEPGEYSLAVSMKGFRRASVSGLRVEVTKSYDYGVRLEVGDLAETINVVAGGRAELQKTDATVGAVVTGRELVQLPSLGRDAVEFLTLQPGTSPEAGDSDNGSRGGAVTGARTDQSTFTVDGIDVTENSTGGGSGFRTMTPVPVESVEEFRVGVTNPNASFGRASGGQVALVGRRGSNDLRGALYWYHQDDALNANSWTNNRNGVPKGRSRDDRFGFRVGGPVRRDRAFFFVNYERRDFQRVFDVARIVPTDTLRQGIVRLRDNAGRVVSYDLANSTLCAATGNRRCDPRGLGLSPAVAALWSLLPRGNDPGSGDGLNTIGWRSTAVAPLRSDYAVARFDYALSARWLLNASASYARRLSTPGGASGQQQQLDIRGGAAAFTSRSPLRGQNVTVGLSQPIDVDSQRARAQINDNQSLQFIYDGTWSRGRHTTQFGSDFRRLITRHVRNDRLQGALSALSAGVFRGGNIAIPAASRPPTCSAAGQTNCLRASDVGQWDALFAAVTGMVDNVSVLSVRDADLSLQPFGSPLAADAAHNAYGFYFQDRWQARPSLALTLGLSYGWQQPPLDRLGRATRMIYADTGEPVTYANYVEPRRRAALAGEIYNPRIAFEPSRASGGRPFRTDWDNVSPRVAVAWNPSPRGGFFGRLFGTHATVLRGGFAVLYDRVNTFESVIIPVLSTGFSQTLSLRAPACNATGAGGAGCNPAGGSSPAAAAFRVGVDGALPVPVRPAFGFPFAPGQPFGETLSIQIDPDFEVGESYSFAVTLQRELPRGVIFEMGWIGRAARKLPANVNFNSSPYFQLDARSGQTFAQAFDAVAQLLRAGATAAGVQPQPWFQNSVPGGTARVLNGNEANFINGNVSSVFQTVDLARLGAGLTPFNNLQSQTAFVRTSTGRSNYHALVLLARRRWAQGLTADLNYTFSKSLDQASYPENSTNSMQSAFAPDFDYGPSDFDRTHIFNARFVSDLPAGRGRWFDAGGPLDALVAPSAAIPVSDPGLLRTGVNRGVGGSNNVGTNGDPATGGSGINLFGDPEAALNSFRRVLISRDGRSGRSNPLRGLPAWNLDLSLAKSARLHERVNARLSLDFFNVFNHPVFSNPALDITNPRSFGVVTQQTVPTRRESSGRWVQLGLRVEF
ncbi:MAG: carboxypeptidase-like regulatory domain-containing protein [Acidobacteria bacterium]|nr:carboxypeptidase-like regulatory domain-containing protein [Acidobacteriota bacterium]